ncbi:HAMP domain-containing sensor histidine kinase [Oscillatoria sp. CS-180]|uniref:sensor histidine kinase n=1 Tax=Oscillatoria sp. CS-180 TaxID=3021720 RepID=UPI00232BFF71|nr:HAMP domain-containing sensor histidine kinase [Oscillatoria sp. CS-180]MDB9525090.1 HAMP domain-containing sensor histidine kinase [Oscillatoria sp. CS-180]
MLWSRLASYFEQLIQARHRIHWLISVIFVLIILLEYSTPPPYVFGYLYVGAVLIASTRLSRRATIWVTAIAIACILLNLLVPGIGVVTPATVANRVIAVLALAVTGWLGDRLQAYEQAITRQRLQLQAQEQLSRMREDFVSTLTHDLKTPLLGALETLKALRSENFGSVSPPQRRVFDVMTRSHQKTLQLVETLMDVYRNDAEGLRLHRQRLDLFILAEEAVADVVPLATSRQIHLRVRDEESDFRRAYCVNGDALQLSRVLVNLLSNAVNHSRRGSSVQVVMGASHGHYQVRIVDEGQGIPNDELPHLFDRFYQGQSDRQAKGTGLGLYLSRQIVEAHGGRIWAESHANGAVFAFRLPAYMHELPLPATSQSTA